MKNIFSKKSDNPSRQSKRNNSKFGLSLVALVIIIAVIIILAAIVFLAYNQIVNKAQFAKFTHETSEIEQKVKEKRSTNQKTSLTSLEEDINKGFRKVYLNNSPEEFKSFDPDDVTGYWVDMNYIDEREIVLGHQEINTIVATFGKDDAFVYDAEGTVYYLKGYLNEDDNYYHKYAVKANMKLLKEPVITNASYQLLDDDTVALVTVHVNPSYGYNVKVKVGNNDAQPTGSYTYAANVYENNNYWVLAKEENGYYTCSPLDVTGIVKPLDRTPPIIDSATVTYRSNMGHVSIKAHDNESKIIAYSFTKQGEDDSWNTYDSYTYSSSFAVNESGVYVFKAKNEVDLIGEATINVNIIHEYTIVYDNNGGVGGPTSQTKIDNQPLVITSDTPTRPSYIFKGWSESSTASEAEYAPGSNYTKNGDTTLFAVWDLHAYTITFNSNGGNPFTIVQSKIDGTNLTLTTDIPEKLGYTFVGWSENATATEAQYPRGGTFTKDADTTLYAVWIETTYTVSYDANGGDGAPESQTKKYSEALTLSSTVPTRTGFSFLGWSNSSTASTAEYVAGGSYSSNADANLFAVWKEKLYTITYNSNGGSGAPENGTKAYGATYTIPSIIPVLENHVFKGWDITTPASNVAYEPGQAYSENADLTLYAIWDVNLYTITYDANGGSGAPDPQSKGFNSTLVLSTTIPSYFGYAFQGWATAADATTPTYQPGGSYVEDGDATLYAVWDYDLLKTDGNGKVTGIKDKYITVSEFIPEGECWTKTLHTFNGSNITIPEYIGNERITSIDEYAFQGITHLESVVIPNHITSIGKGAFSDCEDLISVTMPSSLPSNIPDELFSGCYSLVETSIPSDVTSIGNRAFGSCYSLSSIVMPDGVVSIGNSAFAGCSGVANIDIPTTVRTIGSGAFSWSGIISCTIPDGVTTLESNTFANCQNLTNVEIPSSVTSFGERVFYWCTALQSLEIPNGTTEIPPYMCYACIELKDLVIPNSVTAIKQYAFESCRALPSINIPDSVLTIEREAFRGCSSATSLHLPNNLSTIAELTFAGCSKIPSIDWPSTLTKIEKNAFSECSSLATLDLPVSLVSIADYAFSNCTNLAHVDVCEAALKYIGNKNTFRYIFSGSNNITSINIKEGITRIPYNSFDGRTNLVSVTLPSTLTTIDAYAFRDCTSLSGIQLVDGITTIGGYSFAGCTSITNIDIPNTVTQIGNFAFSKTNIANVVIPFNASCPNAFDSCPNLRQAVVSRHCCYGDYQFAGTGGYIGHVFNGCSNLTIIIPDGITTIGADAFKNCPFVVSVELPNTLQTIGTNSFTNCSSLRSISIPDSVTNIGQNAFSGCTGLTRLDIPSGITRISQNAFLNVSHVYYSGSATGSPWGALAIN